MTVRNGTWNLRVCTKFVLCPLWRLNMCWISVRRNDIKCNVKNAHVYLRNRLIKWMVKILAHVDGLMQKRRNSIADALELRLFSANRSTCQSQCQRNAISKLLYSGITASDMLHTRNEIDKINKFHNAPLPHPISVEQKCARFCSKVVHFRICDWSVFGTPNHRSRMTPLWWGICCVSKITICKNKCASGGTQVLMR